MTVTISERENSFYFITCSWKMADILDYLREAGVQGTIPYRIVHDQEGNEKEFTIVYLPSFVANKISTTPEFKIVPYKYGPFLLPGEGLSNNIYIPAPSKYEAEALVAEVTRAFQIFVDGKTIKAEDFKITCPERDDPSKSRGVFVITSPQADLINLSMVRYVLDYGFVEGHVFRYLWARQHEGRSSRKKNVKKLTRRSEVPDEYYAERANSRKKKQES